MGKPNFSDEFKRDAVFQITERGYPVAKVSQRLGVTRVGWWARPCKAVRPATWSCRPCIWPSGGVSRNIGY